MRAPIARVLARLGGVRTHPATTVAHGALIAEVDLELAPLILEIWKAGITTIHSCQDVGENIAGLAERLPHLAGLVGRERGRASIGFPDSPSALAFLEALANAGACDPFYERMLHWAAPDAWQVAVAVRDEGLRAGEPGSATPPSRLAPVSFQVRFPRSDVGQVLERMVRHNRGDPVSRTPPTWAAITVEDEEEDGDGPL